MESYNYPLAIAPDDNDTLLVKVPDFPEAVTFGEDEADALARGGQVVEIAIEGRMKDHQDIPLPSPAAGRPTVTLAATIAAKVAIYRAMRAAGINNAELAGRLGWHRPQVGRLLDINHASRMDHLERVLALLGKRLASR